MIVSASRPGALFVDFENVYYGILNGQPSLQPDMALSATLDALAELRRRLRESEIGLVVERCYADWERLPQTAQRQLQISGVLPRFVDSRVDKSSADIELSLDVLSYLIERDELAYFVLVGGDRDYLPILRRLKERQRSIHVCALRGALSGDVREFAANYAAASVQELDELVDLSKYHRASAPTNGRSAHVPAKPDANDVGTVVAPLHYEPGCDQFDWHERYVRSMLRFLRGHSYQEVHLGPFFRWLQGQDDMALVSVREKRRVFDELVRMGAILLEEREGSEGFAFSVALVNWNHPMVRTVNEA